MEIILKEDIEKIGAAGDVVSVADGYARNYLLPRGMAVKATSGKVKQVRQKQKKQKSKKAEKEKEAREQAQKLEEKKFVFPVKAGEKGRLFGSVTSKDIVEKVKDAGYVIEKRNIELGDNIKELGVHNVPVKLYNNIYAELKIEVVEK